MESSILGSKCLFLTLIHFPRSSVSTTLVLDPSQGSRVRFGQEKGKGQGIRERLERFEVKTVCSVHQLSCVLYYVHLWRLCHTQCIIYKLFLF